MASAMQMRLAPSSGQRLQMRQQPRAWRGNLRRPVLVTATAAKEAPPAPAPAADNSFMAEMRTYAMKLHTRDQAKEGGQEAAKRPFQEWVPKRAGFLAFMVESKEVYAEFERILRETPAYKLLDGTGLERTEALQRDIEYMQQRWGLKPHTPTHDGPGRTYARFLRELAATNPPAFICHYYNHYFAHTAGGRMIGAKVSQVALENWMGDFYKWDGDVKELLNGARSSMEAIASGWTRAQKDACLAETPATFGWGGSLVKLITEDRAPQPSATGFVGWWRRICKLD